VVAASPVTKVLISLRRVLVEVRSCELRARERAKARRWREVKLVSIVVVAVVGVSSAVGGGVGG